MWQWRTVFFKIHLDYEFFGPLWWNIWNKVIFRIPFASERARAHTIMNLTKTQKKDGTRISWTKVVKMLDALFHFNMYTISLVWNCYFANLLFWWWWKKNTLTHKNTDSRRWNFNGKRHETRKCSNSINNFDDANEYDSDIETKKQHAMILLITMNELNFSARAIEFNFEL